MLQVDLHQQLDLEVMLENFPVCRSLAIPPGTTDCKIKIYLQDVEKRILELLVIIKAGVGGSQQVHDFCLQCNMMPYNVSFNEKPEKMQLVVCL